MSAQFTAASNNYLEQTGCPVSAYPYCHAMKIRFVDGASIPNADLAGFGDITSGGADYEYHQIQSRTTGSHARFERADANNFFAATAIGGFGGGAYDHAVTERRHAIEWVTVIINAAAANDIKIYAAKTLADIVASEATDTNSLPFTSDFNGANGRFRVGRGSFSGATSDANFFCAEHVVMNRVMTAAEMVDYHRGLKLTAIPTIAAAIADVKYYASYASAVTAEIGTNMSNVSTVTFDADIHPHVLADAPSHWSDVPRAFTKTAQKEDFRALLYDNFATAKRIAMFGDSTGIEVGGAGNWSNAARRGLWHLIRGHTPATPPMPPNVSFGLPSGDEGEADAAEYHMLAHGFSVDASALAGEYANEDLPPQYNTTTIRKIGLDTNGASNGGQGFWLHVNHAAQFTNVLPQILNTGNPAFALNDMALGKSMIDAVSGMRVKVCALTFTGSAASVIWVMRRLQTFAAPPAAGQEESSGLMFEGAETLDAAAGILKVETSGIIASTMENNNWYYFQVAGNEEAGRKAIIFAVQIISENQNGLDFWVFAHSGYHTSTFVLDSVDGTTNHAGMWDKLLAIGFDAFHITVGTNDDDHPAIFDYFRRELIDAIRTEMGDANMPIILEAPVFQKTVVSSGSFTDTREWHAGVDHQIAQDLDDVLFLNTRRISEEEYNFEANEATYLQDDVHWTRAGGVVVAKSSVWGMAEYFGVRNGFRSGGGSTAAAMMLLELLD